MPLGDEKNKHCEPFNFIEIPDVGLFRIVPSLTVKNATNEEIEYRLEHVIATLLDDVLFGYHQTTNYTTRQNINYILEQQTVKHWRLGSCDFERFFHYKYENENGLLGPLLAIPQLFDEGYQWTYNTSSYPWIINLVKPSTTPTCEIRYAVNLRGIERLVDTSEIVNRIYPLGAGEGVNQLRITDINANKPYLEDSVSIAKHGLKSYVWIDKSFEDAATLKANAQGLLTKWSSPRVSYKVSAADLTEITGASIHKLVEGAVVRITDPELGVIEQRILSERKPDITGSPGEIELEIGNLSDDIATLNAEIQRRQQVNDAYTQGSTNIDSHNYNDNCDSSHPAVIRFYLPNDLVNVNTMSLSYETDAFRAYSRATDGGGSTTKTTTSGGGTTATSSSGGGVSTSTSSGGGTVQSSSAGGDHRHRMFGFVSDMGSTNAPSNFKNFMASANSSGSAAASVFMPGVSVDLYTDGSSGNHSHSVSVPNHTHSFSVPNHSHSVSIPNHSHSVTLPDHTHEIQHGIYELPTKPSAVTVKVDGKAIPGSSITGNDIDIVPYLAKDSGGRIQRGTWHEVTLTPNGLGRINANIISRLFISSHIGGSY
jgi:phage minor structural protein